MPSRITRTEAAAAVALLLGGCAGFQGIYREADVPRLPAADCAWAVLERIDGVQPLRREAWHGDPLLTLGGSVAPMGRGTVIHWQSRDGQPVELWLLDAGPDGPRLWQIHDGHEPAPALDGLMQRVEAALISDCLRTADGGKAAGGAPPAAGDPGSV